MRLFLAATALVVLSFGLRLVYRYWVDWVANNFLKTLGATVIFLLISAPVLLLGWYLIVLAEPDFSQKPDFEGELDRIVDSVQPRDDE